MDYSNFVRNFYRQALTQLKGFHSYYGKIVNVNKELGIDSNFLHKETNNSMFLPRFELNINAPTKCFIDFMDYYVSMYPDLGVVFANKDRLNQLYNNAVEMNALEDDEKVLDYINLLVNVGVLSLEQAGILEK